jgi:hypothetical protein
MSTRRLFYEKDSNKPRWKGLGVKRRNGKCITIKNKESRNNGSNGDAEAK